MCVNEVRTQRLSGARNRLLAENATPKGQGAGQNNSTTKIGGSRAPPIVNLVLSGELELRLITIKRRFHPQILTMPSAFGASRLT